MVIKPYSYLFGRRKNISHGYVVFSLTIDFFWINSKTFCHPPDVLTFFKKMKEGKRGLEFDVEPVRQGQLNKPLSLVHDFFLLFAAQWSKKKQGNITWI